MLQPSSRNKEAVKDAQMLSKETGVTEKPYITTRADAQDKADRRNYTIQAAIGAKEGAAEAITITKMELTSQILFSTMLAATTTKV